ncbi:hypothetical protein D9611_012412 [Ephemerocybe angulata]|uniref:Ribonuclease H1 N-terminal domain-containing protein n=1 Tax=Ephemerocybe angulata TaxID=980116 RepID=A0A8H5CEX3_9AGAR|nr:hypothetical protein D9611_012412 [Tulosesus angulatus]
MTEQKETPSTPRINGTITLTDLMSTLRALGVNVSSPHEDMVRESTSAGSPPPPGVGVAIGEEAPPTLSSQTRIECIVAALRSLGLDVSAPAPSSTDDATTVTAPAAIDSGAPPTATDTGAGAALEAGAAAPAPPNTLSAGGRALSGLPPLPVPAPSNTLSAGGRALSGLPPLPAALPAGATITSPSGAVVTLSPASIPVGGAVGSAPRPQDASNPISGFVCVNCNTHNLVRPARETWYVVTVGLQVGVFQGWHSVQPLVSGVRGACYRKYASQEDAVAAFQEALTSNNVRSVQQT